MVVSGWGLIGRKGVWRYGRVIAFFGDGRRFLSDPQGSGRHDVNFPSGGLGHGIRSGAFVDDLLVHDSDFGDVDRVIDNRRIINDDILVPLRFQHAFLIYENK